MPHSTVETAHAVGFSLSPDLTVPGWLRSAQSCSKLRGDHGQRETAVAGLACAAACSSQCSVHMCLVSLLPMTVSARI